MGEELPILKGILNGVVNYHNARRCPALLGAPRKKKKKFKNRGEDVEIKLPHFLSLFLRPDSKLEHFRSCESKQQFLLYLTNVKISNCKNNNFFFDPKRKKS